MTLPIPIDVASPEELGTASVLKLHPRGPIKSDVAIRSDRPEQYFENGINGNGNGNSIRNNRHTKVLRTALESEADSAFSDGEDNENEYENDGGDEYESEGEHRGEDGNTSGAGEANLQAQRERKAILAALSLELADEADVLSLGASTSPDVIVGAFTTGTSSNSVEGYGGYGYDDFYDLNSLVGVSVQSEFMGQKKPLSTPSKSKKPAEPVEYIRLDRREKTAGGDVMQKNNGVRAGEPKIKQPRGKRRRAEEQIARKRGGLD
jgi:hypothetical protein